MASQVIEKVNKIADMSRAFQEISDKTASVGIFGRKTYPDSATQKYPNGKTVAMVAAIQQVRTGFFTRVYARWSARGGWNSFTKRFESMQSDILAGKKPLLALRGLLNDYKKDVQEEISKTFRQHTGLLRKSVRASIRKARR